MAEETPQEKANREAQEKQNKDKTSRISQMKGEASRTSQLADMLAKKIPSQGGMSVEDFENKWIPNFEKGYTNLTPDPADDTKPYGDDYSKRPRVKILSKGTNT